MAFILSAADVAIAQAQRAGTLSFVERASRFGDSFVSIEDDVGVIEVADTMPEAVARAAPSASCRQSTASAMPTG